MIPNIPARFMQSASMLIYHQVIFPDTYATIGIPELHYVIKAGEKIEADLTEPISVSSSKLAGNDKATDDLLYIPSGLN